MVSTLSRRLSPRHYRPMWDEAPATAPRRDVVSLDRLKAALPQMTVGQLLKVKAFLDAPDGVVDTGVFGMDYGQQRRMREVLARHGITFAVVRLKGYRLDENGLKTVRTALEKVPG